jgi:hypothetical protein
MGRPIRFNHACVAGLNRIWLSVVADLGNRPAGTVDQIDEKFVGLSFSNDAVNLNLDHSFFLCSSRSKSVPGRDQFGYRDRLNTFDACDFFHSPQHSREVLFRIACQLL